MGSIPRTQVVEAPSWKSIPIDKADGGANPADGASSVSESETTPLSPDHVMSPTNEKSATSLAQDALNSMINDMAIGRPVAVIGGIAAGVADLHSRNDKEVVVFFPDGRGFMKVEPHLVVSGYVLSCAVGVEPHSNQICFF